MSLSTRTQGRDRKTLGTLTTACLLLAGCATVPAKVARQTVDTGLRSVLGVVVDSPSESKVSAEVQSLLGAPLTAEAAVRIALLRSPEMQREYAQLDIAAADVLEASRLSNPTLELARLWPHSGDAERQTVGNIGISLTDLLLLPARRRQGRAEFRGAQQLAAANIHTLALDVQSAWLEAMAAQQHAVLQGESAASAKLSADLTERYQAAGNVDALSLTLRQAEESEATIEAARATQMATQSRARLRRLLGLTASDPSMQLPRTLPPPTELGDDRSALHAAARTQRLDLKAARSAVDALQEDLQSTRRFRWLGHSEIAALTEREGAGGERRGAGISAELPVFQQGQSAIARSRARLAQAEAQVRAIEVAIDAEVAAQLEQIALAQQQYTVYREKLIPQREQVMNELVQRVNFMLTGPFDLLLAKRQEYAAYAGALTALHDYWQSRIGLARALGAPLPQMKLEETP